MTSSKVAREELVQGIVLVWGEVDGLRFGTVLKDGELRVVVADPVESDGWVLVHAAARLEKPLHLRQRVELSCRAACDNAALRRSTRSRAGRNSDE